VQRLVRPLRFVAFSVPLFLAWEWLLRTPYLTLLAHTFALMARACTIKVHVVEVTGGDIRFAYGDVVWVDEFGLTGVNVVAFLALVLATGPVTWRRRGRMLAAGAGLLFATQILGLWTDIVHVHLHTRPSTAAFANGLRAFMTGFGTFFFPLFIWLWLVRDHLPFSRAAQTGRVEPR
jgi:hypothetical protein